MRAGWLNFGLPHCRHIAVWGDLDAHGIAIITDLAERLGRQVHPVGMEPELFQNGVRRIRKEAERQEARQLAVRLTNIAPEPLRPLAALIAATGDSCEQETIRAQVTPRLGATLRRIEATEADALAGSTGPHLVPGGVTVH